MISRTSAATFLAMLPGLPSLLRRQFRLGNSDNAPREFLHALKRFVFSVWHLGFFLRFLSHRSLSMNEAAI